MLGTFAGALDARKINAKEGRLSCEVRGEVEDDGGVLIIKRVHVTHNLRADDPAAVRRPWSACMVCMRKAARCIAR